MCDIKDTSLFNLHVFNHVPVVDGFSYWKRFVLESSLHCDYHEALLLISGLIPHKSTTQMEWQWTRKDPCHHQSLRTHFIPLILTLNLHYPMTIRKWVINGNYLLTNNWVVHNYFGIMLFTNNSSSSILDHCLPIKFLFLLKNRWIRFIYRLGILILSFVCLVMFNAVSCLHINHFTVHRL